MKPYVKEYNDKITNKLLVKDMLIAFLVIALILTNHWFTFSGLVQLIFTILSFLFVVTGLIFSFDIMAMAGLSNKLSRKINDQIAKERTEVKEEKDEKSLA